MLLTLGTYESGRDLSLFFAKFEKVMADCKEPKNNWLTDLYPKLPEVLCARIDNLPDEQKNYDQVKIVLLQSVGETVGKFGAKFLSLTISTCLLMSTLNMSAEQSRECFRNAKMLMIMYSPWLG